MGDASRIRDWLLVSGGEISSGLSATVGPYLINLGLIASTVGDSDGSTLDDNGASDGGTDWRSGLPGRGWSIIVGGLSWYVLWAAMRSW